MQGCRSGIDENDLGAHLSSRRGDFRTNPAGTNHRHPAGGADGVSEAARIGDRAEVVDAGEGGSGDVEWSWRGAGRKHSRREWKALAAVEADVAGVRRSPADSARRAVMTRPSR